MTEHKKAALLLAFGGADSLDSVEPFVKNVLKGREVPQELVKRTKERYSLIGGKSPLLDITNAQARAIEEILKKQGDDYKIYVGMRYWHPYIKETLQAMKADGVKKADAVVMAPISSRIATGGYMVDVDNARSLDPELPFIEYIADWHINPAFIDIIVENVKNELGAFADKKDALVIFSTHSLPMAALEGDPYEMKIQQMVSYIVKKLPVDFKLGYQSQGAGPRQWLGPRTEDVIIEARNMGKKGVIIVPLGFVADHIETLYDIDILFKEVAESNGLAFRRCASLNTNPKFIEFLAYLIKNRVGIYR